MYYINAVIDLLTIPKHRVCNNSYKPISKKMT